MWGRGREWSTIHSFAIIKCINKFLSLLIYYYSILFNIEYASKSIYVTSGIERLYYWLFYRSSLQFTLIVEITYDYTSIIGVYWTNHISSLIL